MLAVGIDWAEDYHLVALGRPGEGVTEVARVEHTPGAVAALLGRIAALEPDPAEVRVVLETRHGTLVEQLLDAGFTVGRSTPTWLRQELLATFPAALEVAAGDLAAPTILKLLERWPPARHWTKPPAASWSPSPWG